MKVNHVELISPLRHHFDEQCMGGNFTAARTAQPQRAWMGRNQLGPRLRIAAGKQRDVVPGRNELVGQVRDDSFGATVETGWNTLAEWRNLCNSECSPD